MLHTQNKSKLTKDEVGTLILLAALLFGALFRFLPTLFAGFPVNDGGMFHVMMQDLQANHFLPPLYTTYNNLNIPFAYPPLALYIGAGISSLFKISSIEILRWLPAFVNTASILSFYFLSKEILDDKFKSAIAALAFALIPHLTTWLSAGGGITRSFGTLFMILTVLCTHRLFTKNNPKAIWGAIIFGSLTVLSHTESTIFAIALPIYVWFAKSRSLKTALQGGWIALGVVALAGPWYAWVIFQHGMETLLSALQTGGLTLWSFFRLINVDMITEEPYLDILGVLGILGTIFLIIRKEYFIPGMLGVIYVVEPRSAHTISNIPLAIAAGIFITETLLPTIERLNGANGHKPNRGTKIFFILLTPFLLVNSVYQGFLLSQNHVSRGEQAAMRWVKENTPKESQFLLLTGEMEAMCEASAEWFPALTERQSLTTLQGREWLIGKQFGEFIGHRASLQSCIDENMECMSRAAEYFGNEFEYIYISIKTPTNNCEAINSSTRTTRGLVTALEYSSEYRIVYRSEDAIIFEKAAR